MGYMSCIYIICMLLACWNTLGTAAFECSGETCSNPKLLYFDPKRGPAEGGTELKITGNHLGNSFDDIEAVTVAGFPCILLEEHYESGSVIVCEIKTDLPPGVKHYEGSVVVKLKNQALLESSDRFEFEEFGIDYFTPKEGPRSGGSRLVIVGYGLDVGSSFQVLVDDSPCKITYHSGTQVRCITQRAKTFQQSSAKINVKIDKTDREFVDKFVYVDDPEITSAEAGYFDNEIRVITGGGINIRVKGYNFDKISQSPTVYITYDNQDYAGPCRVETAHYMACTSPKIPADEATDFDNPLNLKIGFIMDNVTDYGNYNATVYPNPIYNPFDEPHYIKHFKSDYLTINGLQLDTACTTSDITVEIGSDECLVTSISKRQLTCRPPRFQPGLRKQGVYTLCVDTNGNKYANILPEVTVVIGKRIRHHIGYLKYEPEFCK